DSHAAAARARREVVERQDAGARVRGDAANARGAVADEYVAHDVRARAGLELDAGRRVRAAAVVFDPVVGDAHGGAAARDHAGPGVVVDPARRQRWAAVALDHHTGHPRARDFDVFDCDGRVVQADADVDRRRSGAANREPGDTPRPNPFSDDRHDGRTL